MNKLLNCSSSDLPVMCLKTLLFILLPENTRACVLPSRDGEDVWVHLLGRFKCPCDRVGVAGSQRA